MNKALHNIAIIVSVQGNVKSTASALLTIGITMRCTNTLSRNWSNIIVLRSFAFVRTSRNLFRISSQNTGTLTPIAEDSNTLQAHLPSSHVNIFDVFDRSSFRKIDSATNTCIDRILPNSLHSNTVSRGNIRGSNKPLRKL